jgi:hypothetical protein
LYQGRIFIPRKSIANILQIAYDSKTVGYFWIDEKNVEAFQHSLETYAAKYSELYQRLYALSAIQGIFSEELEGY